MTDTLTDRQIRGFKAREKQYEVADAKVKGLSIRVLPSGARRWSYRYRLGKQWRRVALGPYPAIGLADARDLAEDKLFDVKKGRDPSAEKRQRLTVKIDSFGALADLYVERYAKPKKRSWREDARRLKSDVPRSWRQRPAAEITRRDVRELIESKGIKAPISANRLRALLHKAFTFGVEREIVPFNPVTGTPRPGVERQRDRVLSDDEIRAFWAATEPGVAEDSMTPPMSAYWRLRLVTAQRAVEVNSMRWEDLDFDNAIWTIPAGVVKNKLAHRVPLSGLALEIIAGLHQFDEYVIAGARGKRQQSAAKKMIVLDDFIGHDLRRTAATGMTSSGISRFDVGKILNHAETGVTAVYDRASYDTEKRVALDTWARKLQAIIERTEGADVMPFAKEGRR